MAIEIEKKFLLTADQQDALLKDATDLGHKQVENIYFDTADYSLSLRDFWLRRRDGVYELKTPVSTGSGSFGGTNRYHELTDDSEIAEALGIEISDTLERSLTDFDIHPFVTCYTDRASYEKQGFHIDIDQATYRDSVFSYAVAEIELLVETEDEANGADNRIMAFAADHNLTSDTVIHGKIGAFLQAERPDHFETLMKAGILK
jgi:thiamine-triphosphatase